MTERPRGGKDELSSTLRQVREDAGMSGRQAAERSGFSQAKVSRIERGINVPTEADVTALLDLYSPPGDVRRRLLDLARDIRAEHRPVVMARGKGRPDLFQARLARIEGASSEVRAFSPTAVPGVLQTEPYIRGVIANRGLPPDRVNAFVEKRLARRALLTRAGRPRFTIITTEGALGWRLGTAADMADQADHIAEATHLPDARIGVIPWGAQADRLALLAWDIYDDRAVSYGTGEATAILTEPRDVARYVELFGAVERMAVFGDEARALLARIADRYRSLS